jgi:thioesterase domain-containing protein
MDLMPLAALEWGMVAFEIAQRLTRQGDEVSFLGVMDSYPRTPYQVTNNKIQAPQEELQAFFYLLGDIIGRDYRHLLDDLLINALEHEQPIDWLLDQMNQQSHRLVLDHSIIKRIWLTMKRNRQLMETYQPQPYEGLITLFCAQESAPKDGTQRWQALTPHPVDTVWVSGGHYTMLDAAHVDILGHALEKRLQQIVRPTIAELAVALERT